tara:strand:+ start:2995 stop:3195 length:201 start_codon:yes stop_codon:yes gene_type:complete
MCFSAPSPSPPAPVVAPPTEDSAEVKASVEKQRKIAAAKQGQSSTILTGGQGTDEATSTKKTLLGA